MTNDRERVPGPLAIGLACGAVIAAGFVVVFDDAVLGASSGVAFGVAIAALLANRREERSKREHECES